MTTEYETPPTPFEDTAPKPAKGPGSRGPRKPKADTAPKAAAPKSHKRDFRALVEVVNAAVLSTPYAPLALHSTKEPLVDKPVDEVDEAAGILDKLVQNVPALARLMERGAGLAPWAPVLLGVYRLVSRRLETYRLLQAWGNYVAQSQAEGFIPLNFQSWLEMLTRQAEHQQPPPPGTQYGPSENGYHPDPIMSGAME